VALAGGNIVGLLVVDPNTGYLDQIVVATDQQGRGVATYCGARAQAAPEGLDRPTGQRAGGALLRKKWLREDRHRRLETSKAPTTK
jgi:hypothetical protein